MYTSIDCAQINIEITLNVLRYLLTLFGYGEVCMDHEHVNEKPQTLPKAG